MFGGFPQQQRGGQSPFSNMFGGIGGFGGRRQFNPFMNQFGGGGFNTSGGGFNPFMNRFGGGGFNPFARFGGVDPRVGKPTPQEAPADLPPGVEPGGQYFTDPITGNPSYSPPMPKSYPGQMQAMVMPDPIDLTTYKGTPDYSKELPPPFDPSMIFSPEAPAISQEALVKSLPMEMTPMETTAPVMPAAPHLESLGPVIPEMPSAPPTVGPPGTTITPPAPQANQYVSPQEQFLMDYPDLAGTPLTPSPAPVNEYISPQDQFLADYPDWATTPPTLPPGPQAPTGNQYGFTPGDPTKMYSQVMVPWVNKETGETYNAPNPGYQPPPGSAWEEAGFARMDLTQPPPASSPQPLPIGQQPLLPPMPGKEPRPPPFIGGRGPGAPLPPTLPVNIAQENIEREIIPPQLPVSPMQQATPNTLRAQEREPGFTGADLLRQNVGLRSPMMPSVNRNDINERLKKLSELSNTPMQHYSPGGY